MVDWNKEIKLSNLRGKKDADPALEPDPQPEPAADEQPAATPATEAGPAAASEAPTSEAPISEAPTSEAPTSEVPAPEAPTPEAAPQPATQVVHAPKPAKTSLLKKEFSFKRKPNKQPLLEEDEGPDEKASRSGRKRRSRGASSGHKRVKRLVGLKIGGSQIAAARISTTASPELVQVAREPLDHGIVVGGELRDPEALAVALRAFFKRHNLPAPGLRLGIANNRIGVRIFEVAGIEDPKQLANAIRFRAQEVLPIPIEEAVLDYQVLGERVGRRRQPVRRVLLVVAYRELSTATSRPARRPACGSSASTSRRSRCCARSPSRARETPGRRRRHRRRRDRPRPLDVRRLRRPHLRVHARARLGRLAR